MNTHGGGQHTARSSYPGRCGKTLVPGYDAARCAPKNFPYTSQCSGQYPVFLQATTFFHQRLYRRGSPRHLSGQPFPTLASLRRAGLSFLELPVRHFLCGSTLIAHEKCQEGSKGGNGFFHVLGGLVSCRIESHRRPLQTQMDARG